MSRPLSTFVFTILCFFCLYLVGTDIAHASPSASERIDRAIYKAKSGKPDEAINELYELTRIYPDNNRIYFDLTVLLLRNGKYAEGWELIHRFSISQLPDYVVNEAMRALRDGQYFSQALLLAEEYRHRYPDTFDAHAFAVLTMADAGQSQQSVKEGTVLTQRWADTAGAWNTLGYANEMAGQYVEALRAYQKSLQLAPENPEALRRQVMALEKLGASSLAADLMRKKPELFSDNEWSRVVTSQSAALVSQAGQEPSETLRRAAGRRSLDSIEFLLNQTGQDTPSLTDKYRLRLRFDRIIGWRDQQMMQAVLTEYDLLCQEGHDIPGYVQQAAADACLYLEHPEKAAELYRALVTAEPDNVDAKIGLFFALVESEQIKKAHELATGWDQQAPAWIRPEGAPAPVPNPDKISLSELVNLSLYFADKLPEAQERLEVMVQLAPNMSSLRTTLGDLYKSRGWIQKSVEQYELALALDPANISARGGLAEVALTRNQFAEARAAITSLLQEYPQNKRILRLQDDLGVIETWDLTLESGYEESDGETFGSESGFFGGRLYSPYLGDHWRAYADYRYQSATFLEGKENLNRYTLGVLYEGTQLGTEIDLGWVDATVEEGTASARVSWQHDDYLRFGASGELYSKETPLRAIKNDINADRIALDGGYRFSESMDWRWQLGYMDFSDDNRRLDGHTGLYARLYNYHRLVLDGDVALYASHATLEDAAYFNPELQVSLPFTLKTQYMIWREYSRSFWNNLTFEAGPVYQKDFGTDLNWSVNYEHVWKFHPAWEIVYGIGYASRVYDGDREDSWFITFTVH